ncbi:MAG: hypothetical protein EHM61_01105 [Acidobacteria bacterium]|nr:MAG: hypothetical protein EHM61_01105 [Acidobacteriota bacterium]
MPGIVVLFLFLLVCSTDVLFCQAPGGAAPAADKGTSTASSPDAGAVKPPASLDYRLGPGDQLQITLHGFDDPIHVVRVSNSGKIHLPFLRIFPVSGLTPHELEVEIANRLKQQRLIKNPQVQVTVTEFRAQPVYILGEVGLPGQYVLTETRYLLDLITMAGGVSFRSRKEAFLYRRNPNPTMPAKPGEKDAPADPGALYTVTKVDLSGLIDGKEPNLNIPLQGGDLLYVPQRVTGTFYVVGEVLKTGPLEVPEGGPLLVTRAISMAGGPTKTAKMSKGMLVRYDESGIREERPVDFVAIFKGKQPDFEVRANDVIFIPGSKFKTVGYGILGALPQMVGRAAYSSGGGGEGSGRGGSRE